MNYEQVEMLVTDKRFQELKYRQEKTNIFTIVGQTHTEHWHSSFISWLLDPHSSMRLGHFPLARLLNLYMAKSDELRKRYADADFTLKDIYQWNLDEVKFCTEKDAGMNGKKRSIDVYGESGELIIVIENKVNAKENYNHSETGQTKDYFDYVEAHKKKGQRALYFFITANRKQTADADMYVQISYQEFYDCIISKCIEHPQVSEDGKYLLEQYAANLRETLRGENEPMALVNIDLCKSLYDDYSEELDAIFAEVEQTDAITQSDATECVVYAHYQNIFDEIYLSVDEKYGRTPKSRLQRKIVDFTELSAHGLVHDGMRFTMKYDGIVYHARVIASEDRSKCFLQLLDEDQNPYRDPKTGALMGLYNSSSSAGVDAINFYRAQHGIPERVKTLRGTTYWINENGKSLKELIDQL